MKKIITAIILPTFLIFSCSKTEVVTTSQEEIVKKYAKTEILTKKSFGEELKITGKIASSQETTVSSQISGTIQQVNYKVWESVKEWDILAIIDNKTNLLSTNLTTATNSYNNTVNIFDLTKESIAKDLNSAQVQLENAKTTRDNTYASTDQQLKIVQTQLNNIQTQVKNTNNSSVTLLDLAQKSYENANLSLTNFETNSSETLKGFDIKLKSLQDKKSGLSDTIDSTITSSLASIESALIYADTILWVTDNNKNLNDSYEIYLSAKNTNFKTEAETLLSSIFITIKDIKTSNEDIGTKFIQVQKLAQKVIVLYEKMVLVWDNSISSSSFSETTLTTMKTTIKANQSILLWVNSGIVALKNTSTDIDNSLLDLENTINTTKITLSTQKSSLEQAVSIAKTSLENTRLWIGTSSDSMNGNESLAKNQLESTIASIKQTRDSVDNALKIAENQYNSTKAKLDSSLASVKSQLDGVTGQKNSLLQQLDNTSIKAPYSWIITSKTIEVWTLVNPGTPVFAISKNQSKIIKTEVNSDNIKFLKISQEVVISKNWLTSTWTITLVAGSADMMTKMYNVEIKMNDINTSNQFVLWDYVDVYIKKVSSEDNNKLIIPFTSLITGNSGDFYVYLVGSGNILKTQMIKIGESNSHEVVVVDWLNIWDKIVVSGTLNLSEWDSIE